jgi:hypothetical protein
MARVSTGFHRIGVVLSAPVLAIGLWHGAQEWRFPSGEFISPGLDCEADGAEQDRGQFQPLLARTLPHASMRPKPRMEIIPMVAGMKSGRLDPERRAFGTFENAPKRPGTEMRGQRPFAAVFRRATDERLSPNPRDQPHYKGT